MKTINNIKQAILGQDKRTAHLREIVGSMTSVELGRDRKGRDDNFFDVHNEMSAEKLAYLLYLTWNGAPTEEYAKRTYEHLRAIEDSMAGMYQPDRWHYALNKYAKDILARLSLIENMEINAHDSDKLVHELFDPEEGKEHLRVIAERVLWNQSSRINQEGKQSGGFFSALKLATSSLVTYVEQENISHGNITHPLDESVIYSNLIALQNYFISTGKYKTRFEAGCWDSAIDQIVTDVNDRFGTAEGIEKARELRRWYKSIAGEHKEKRERLTNREGEGI